MQSFDFRSIRAPIIIMKILDDFDLLNDNRAHGAGNASTVNAGTDTHEDPEVEADGAAR